MYRADSFLNIIDRIRSKNGLGRHSIFLSLIAW